MTCISLEYAESLLDQYETNAYIFHKILMSTCAEVSKFAYDGMPMMLLWGMPMRHTSSGMWGMPMMLFCLPQTSMFPLLKMWT